MKKPVTTLAFLIPFALLFSQTHFEIVPFATGLDRPTDIAHTQNDKLYIAERDGLIKVVEPDGSVSGTFLDISSLIPSTASERGLLGIAFHPDYPDSAYIYVHYSGSGGDSRISRFNVLTDTDADESSELNLLDISQPFDNHNGGDLDFDENGLLYISIGDGGSGGDPQNNGQDLTTMLGKILRIDIDGGTPYAIPDDNPFVMDAGALDEIWAYGLRNPWRIDYDPLSGGLMVADVGQNSWEEINFMPNPASEDPNYGWRCYEGNHIYDFSECDGMDTFLFPVYEYPHISAGCSGSISGGVIYRGAAIPYLYGKYLYADYCSGQIGMLDAERDFEQDSLQDFANFQIVAFGTDASGELYMAATNEGAIYKFQSVDTAFIFSVELDGNQAGSGSAGTGYAIATFNSSSGQFRISGRFGGLSGEATAAHAHFGDSGESGAIAFGLQLQTVQDTAGIIDTSLMLTRAQAGALVTNGLYVNVHSSANPGGEIRGQIVLEHCPQVYDATAPAIPPFEYKALQLNSAGTIEAGDSVSFGFENAAILLPGFDMETGAVLEIAQKICE